MKNRIIFLIIGLLLSQLLACTVPMIEVRNSYEKGDKNNVASYLDHSDPMVVQEAIKLYISMGGCDYNVLNKNNSPNKDIRLSLAKNLKFCNTQESMNALLRLLKDTEPLVKKYAVESAADNDFCTSECMYLSRKLLNEGDNIVRLSAARALYKRFPVEARQAVTSSLLSKNFFVKKEAIETLTIFKNPKDVAYLAEFANDSDSTIRIAARMAAETITGQSISSEDLAKMNETRGQINQLGDDSEPNLKEKSNSAHKKKSITLGNDPSLADFGLHKSGKINKKAYAVVIGNRDYSSIDIPNVDYAIRDAQLMRKLFMDVMGIPEDNIKYVENAKSSDFNRIFGSANELKGLLFNLATPDSDVFIYYSGHGAPDTKNKDAYFVPVDSDINFIRLSGYPVKQLYKNIESLKARSVTVIIDSCFSGISHAGQIIGSASPVFVEVSNPDTIANEKIVVMTSSKADEISSWDNSKKHGLFTYYFVMGFKEAIANKDGVITIKEMEKYLSQKVPYAAKRLVNREQTPQVFGNKDRALLSK